MGTAREVILPVTLEHEFRPGDDDNMLVINGGDHCLEFDPIDPPSPNGHMWHTITLRLTGNASAGEFGFPGDPLHPAFTWLLRTPGHVNLLPAAKEIQLLNHHLGHASRGRWYYQLFARFGSHHYGVPLTFSAGGGNNRNPSIKNR